MAARKNYLSRSVPEIYSHVAGTLSNKQTNPKGSLSAAGLFLRPDDVEVIVNVFVIVLVNENAKTN